MTKATTKYPVVLFLYKRPESTATILNLASQAGINKLYLFVDGAKNDADAKITSQVKKVVKDFAQAHQRIKLITHFSRTNQGLKKSIISGLNEVFKLEEAAIILEDDCIPNSDFFKFTQAMLVKYKNSPAVLSVAGTSIGKFSPASYDFSRFQLCWGWATWKRAWQKYEPNLVSLADFNLNYLSPLSRLYWHSILLLVSKNLIDTWDYQWSFTHFINHGLSIIPATNLVTNIGFDNKVTNTKSKTSVAGMMVSDLSWPLNHPDKVIENIELSRAIDRKFYLHAIAFLGLVKFYLYNLLGFIHAKKA